MKGVRLEWKEGDSYVCVKNRGKLTLSDIEQALIEAGMEGYAVVILKACGSYQDGFEPESIGDAADVHILSEDGECPVCRRVTPLIQYCPHCGMTIRDTGGTT